MAAWEVKNIRNRNAVAFHVSSRFSVRRLKADLHSRASAILVFGIV
jgi:hypothetical protein